jgi:long-chain acyl-CoA synthetase
MADFRNLVDVLERSAARFGPRDLFGTKRGPTWEWLSYAAFLARVNDFRAALAELGVGRGDRVAIVANNSVEWAVAAFATYGRSAVYVPMYEAQTPADWEFILGDCEAKLALAGSPRIFEELSGFQGRLPALKRVLGLTLPASDERSYEHWLERGRGQTVPADDPDPALPAGFIYTSGTTGQPKGAILSHGNFCTNLNDLEDAFPLGPEDRSLAFLYWAHSFGQTAELYMLLSKGCSMALNDSVEQLLPNLADVRPTVLIAVPRIFNRIYDRVNQQMSERPAPLRALFHAAIRAATRRGRGEALGLAERLALGLADRLMFGKIRARVGGRLRMAVSGSAALSKEVAEFVDALGIAVYEGYGLTEASPVVSVNRPGARKIGSVGQPLASVRVEIDRSVTGDELNGEIVVFGGNVMQGYHNRPDETRAMLTPEHALRTGDMGHLDADNFLFITGRIKEQYKLENGKYVVPSPLEEELKLSPYVLNAMLYGANRAYNVALIVLDLPAVERWARASHLKLDDPTRDPRVRELIKSELEQKSQGFRGYERPRDFALIREDFSVENGLLTPSLKLRRGPAVERYAALLEALYVR